MAFRDGSKQKLSKSILEMKFMKRSKEKAEKEQEAEEGQAMFQDIITVDMKKGGSRYITEPSFVPCENLIEGRLSFLGMNPEIERILELEDQEARLLARAPPKEKDVTDEEMAARYGSLVGTISNKFKSKKQKHEETEPSKKKFKFIKPPNEID